MKDNTRYVLHCTSESCNHYFLAKWWGLDTKCPKCKSGPVNMIKIQGMNRWKLKDAKKISECLRYKEHKELDHFIDVWCERIKDGDQI